jgi:hypothetical protein
MGSRSEMAIGDVFFVYPGDSPLTASAFNAAKGAQDEVPG